MKIDIVGGGLAGLSTAISLKRLDKNIDVTIHEKHKEIGYNPEGRRCGEGHTVEAEWRKWKPIGKSIFNEIKIVETILENKKYIARFPPEVFYVLNRQEFISQLGRDAKKLGVTIQTTDKIKSSNDLSGDYIVDASGCPSSIKRDLGIDKGYRGISYQQTLEDSNCFISDVIKVFFTDALGYYWIFPRDPEKREINVGVGVLDYSRDFNLKQMLESFKEEQGLEGKINYVLGGMVPVGLQKPLSYQNVLFVGDAGVGTHPLLGKGIYRALYSGELAAKYIALGHPEKYAKIAVHEFIKWDLIGKTYIKIDKILFKIGEKAVLSMYHHYLDFWYSFH